MLNWKFCTPAFSNTAMLKVLKFTVGVTSLSTIVKVWVSVEPNAIPPVAPLSVKVIVSLASVMISSTILIMKEAVVAPAGTLIVMVFAATAGLVV